MYNALNIAINPGTLQFKLPCKHIVGTGNVHKLYADYLAAPHTKLLPIAPL